MLLYLSRVGDKYVEVSRVDLTDLPPRGDHHVAIDDAIPLYFHVLELEGQSDHNLCEVRHYESGYATSTTSTVVSGGTSIGIGTESLPDVMRMCSENQFEFLLGTFERHNTKYGYKDIKPCKKCEVERAG